MNSTHAQAVEQQYSVGRRYSKMANKCPKRPYRKLINALKQLSSVDQYAIQLPTSSLAFASQGIALIFSLRLKICVHGPKFGLY